MITKAPAKIALSLIVTGWSGLAFSMPATTVEQEEAMERALLETTEQESTNSLKVCSVHKKLIANEYRTVREDCDGNYWKTYQYDANGNLTSSADSKFKYLYQAFNTDNQITVTYQIATYSPAIDFRLGC